MNRKGNAGLIAIIIIVVALAVGGYFAVKTLLRPAPTTKTTTTFTNSPGDIDRSGAANESDKAMIRAQLGCTADAACWNTTVGKTKDGDNPIYTSDLDLSKDGLIDETDVALVK